MQIALVGALDFGIGVSVGLSGLGGFLLVPVLIAFLGMGPRTAVLHALGSFVLPGAFGAFLYQRYRGLSWSIALLLSAGTLPGTFAGRLISLSVSHLELQIVLGGALIAASVAILVRSHLRPRIAVPPRPMAAIVVLVGCASGVLGVVAGVGGPLIVVPILLSLGVEMTPLVGAAILNSAVVSIAGAVALVTVVTIGPIVLGMLVGVESAGMALGVWLRPKVGDALLMPLVAGAAGVVGVGLILHSFW